jgi:hypothetical protein
MPVYCTIGKQSNIDWEKREGLKCHEGEGNHKINKSI